ncbi:MAG: hypothetical protein JO133_13235 [Burkholderiaceae bacterium]|nr:hypothetical protein [Burkholderiaceae bacterium]
MLWRVVVFVAALLAGIALFSVGGAWRMWPLQIAGLALVIGCIFAGFRWSLRQYKPPPIKPASNPAWSMRDEPAPGQSEPPTSGS